jgi:hypothetical protein
MILICLVLYLCTDTLIAFKSTIVYCIGVYLLVILKVIYQSPRPFWTSFEIQAYEGYCEFNYASPSISIFNAVFFMNYNIFMYFQKYTPVVYIPVVISLYILSFLYLIVVSTSLHVFGLLYYYQIVVSALFSFVYLIICIRLDDGILTQMEKTGFIVKSSRKYKFYLIFITMMAYMCG